MTYIIRSYNQAAVENCKGNLKNITGYTGERTAETLKQAKKEAEYMLSDEYRISGETSKREAYARIENTDGEVVFESYSMFPMENEPKDTRNGNRTLKCNC